MNQQSIDVHSLAAYSTSAGTVVLGFSLSEISAIVTIICMTVATIITITTFVMNIKAKKRHFESELRGKKRRK